MGCLQFHYGRLGMKHTKQGLLILERGPSLAENPQAETVPSALDQVNTCVGNMLPLLLLYSPPRFVR
jgi:hypothetical protein